MPRAACSCAAMMLLSFAGEMRAQNLLNNPGYETGSLTNWTTFQANNYLQAGSPVRSGTYSYKVFGQFNTSYNYTGIYQDNPSAPGAIYSAGGWGCSIGGDVIHGQDQVWIEVSFRDSSSNALALYRSPVVTGANIASFGGTNVWLDLQITNQCSFTNASALILSPGTVINAMTGLVAPPGTAYVRYQLVFAQGPDNANGSMYFDDLTLSQTGGTVTSTSQWNIVWSDEFSGASIDTTKWTFENGNNNGWGNHELEYYTSSSQNAYVSNGLLHIAARQQSIGNYSFTSARMKTQGLYNTPTYGRIQWRAALPAGLGMWPALWMMGSDYPSVPWPTCGEIDVVENNGAQPFWVQGSLHSGPSRTNVISFWKVYDYPAGDPNGTSTTNFHIYELDWSATSISWLVDGAVYEVQSTVPPFNQPFFLIMNLAVGGDYVGNPSVSTIEASNTFPQEMLVDYVRVYEQTAPLQISTAQTNGGFDLIWPTNIACHLQTQTNSLTSGTWSDLSGTADPFFVVPDSTLSVFYRLESP
jgi:beta-glucanase (GH16 family)